MTKTRGITIAVLAVVVLGFVVFVWPTRYLYEHTTIQGDAMLVRIDRVSGKAAILDGLTWDPIDEYQSSPGTITTHDSATAARNFLDSLPPLGQPASKQ